MKKIVYLVAPLVAMPFLLGCNKVKTHKVQSVQTTLEKLTFTTMKGKNLKGSAFNHKQNFKFKVEANNSGTEGHYTVDPNGIGIYVGKDAVMPLLDGYSVEYTNAEKTAATVTIFANKVTDDIYIRSIAGKDGSYIYSTPLMYDVEMADGKSTLDWQQSSVALELQFKGKGEKAKPTADCFLYTDDAENFYYEDEDTESWYGKHISCDTTGDVTKVTVKANSVNTGYLLIGVRSGEPNYLDSLEWDEINEITEQGLAPYLFRIGDKKTVNVKIGTVDESHKVRIIGFNHDKENSITFQFENVISDATGSIVKRQWHSKLTSGDFENSDFNTSLKEEVFPRLPEDLQKNIETVTKYVGKRNNGAWVLGNYSAQLFPLALVEVLGENEDIRSTYAYAVEGEGTRYEYFKKITYYEHHDLRVLTDVKGNAATYWLRSPNNYNNNGVANCIDSTGAIDNNGEYVTTAYGVAPAFVI